MSEETDNLKEVVDEDGSIGFESKDAGSIEFSNEPVEKESHMGSVRRNRVFVLRALPGAGKTELANFLANSLASDKGAVVLSSDDFFFSKEGRYDFDATRITDAHKWNFQRFKQAIDDGIETIIIDNSNIKQFHYYQYVDYGQRHDYQALILTIPHNDLSDKELEERTPHNISRKTIKKMRGDFEWEMKA